MMTMRRRVQAGCGLWTIRGAVVAVAVGADALGVVLLSFTVWVAASAWVLFHAADDRDQTADVRPLRRIITASLPVGSTMGQARAVLRSRAVTAFVARRGFDALQPDMSFRLVPSFDGTLDESEVYARGAALFAGARNGGDGAFFTERSLTVRLFFDATGRFTHCAVDESVPAS